MSEYSKLKKTALVKLAKSRNLDSTGTKAEIIARLEAKPVKPEKALPPINDPFVTCGTCNSSVRKSECKTDTQSGRPACPRCVAAHKGREYAL
ncbi:MAG: SAP domain-containing protein [Gemmatimonadales bacterium]|nr:SAP domain-containing protein [Gemmatimonadales bacterium]